jgi:hypothetical protein
MKPVAVAWRQKCQSLYSYAPERNTARDEITAEKALGIHLCGYLTSAV